MATNHQSATPLAVNRKIPEKIFGIKTIYVVLIGIIAFAIIGSIISDFSAPSSSGGGPVKNSTNSAGSSGVNVGVTAPTAQFNERFAQQLRVAQENSIRALAQELSEKQAKSNEEAMARLDARIAEQTAAFKAELQSQTPLVTQTVAATPPSEPRRVIAPGGAAAATGGVPASNSSPQPIPPQSTANIPTSGSAEPNPPEQFKAIIPPQGFIKARLLNGVIVRSEQPRVVLARMSGSYIAPNGYKASLDGCLASIEVVADFSAGRIDGKPVAMTCNVRGGFSKTYGLAGYIVDQDGIRGIRASISNNAQQKITIAGVSGALTGVGTVLSQRQIITTTDLRQTTTAAVGDVGRAAAGGLLEGVGKGVQGSLQEYYQLFQTTMQTDNSTVFSIVILNQIELGPEAAHLSPLKVRADGATFGNSPAAQFGIPSPNNEAPPFDQSQPFPR
jgi:hypothetical protein